VRGQRVLLDADLARFYGESTKRLNQQVRRNRERFPEDFMFELTAEEFADLRLQSATSSAGHGGRRYAPLAFTEHGAIMASMVLNSERATALGVYVVRAFLDLRALIGSNKELATKVHALERKVSVHERSIGQLADAMSELLAAPAPQSKRPIGFITPEDKGTSKKTSKAKSKT
jgi:ORF6N domain